MFGVYERIGLDKIISKIKSENMNVVLFGGGTFGEKVLYILSNKGIGKNIKCFCDNDSKKWGKTLLEKKIMSYVDSKKNHKNAIYIICSTYHIDIEEQLKNLKEDSYYIFPECLLRYEKKWYEIMDKSSKSMILKWNKIYNNEVDEKIKSVKKILSDDESIEVLESIINYRKSNDFSYTEKVYSCNIAQYFDPSIVNLSEKEVLVDCGAWDGDTIKKFSKATNDNYKKIISFEPGIEQYNKILEVKKVIRNKNIDVYNMGVWKCKDTLKFIDNSDSSKIDCTGSIEIKVDSLDNILNDNEVTFIKMDIEGAEKEALIGSKNVIKKNKPKLAICAYHNPEDIYEIPLLINTLFPEYRIYLRHHSEFHIETVCYAVIEE